MNPIAQGLALGYSAQKLIGFLSKAFPSLTPKIRQAQRNGHTAEQVLGFLSKTMDNEVPKGVSQQEVLKATDRNQEMLTKHGLAALGGSAATYALSRAIPRIAQGLLPGAGQPPPAAPNPNPVHGQPGAAPQTQQMPGVQNNQPNALPQQPPVNQVAGNIPQAPQPQQPKTNITQLFNKHNAIEKIDDLIKSGNGAETVAAYFKKFFPQMVKDIEKETGGTVEDAIGRYAEEKQAAPQEQKMLESEGKKLDVPKETGEVKQETKPISKNEIVASPQGVGEVREIRGDKALVEVDGKLHKVDIEDLEGEPEEVKNSKFDFDLADVPEDLRSAPLNEVYTPSDRRHVTVKYNAGLKPVRYLYYRKDGRPLSEDYVNKIKEGTQLPVSSGMSFWGVWNADKSDSRGAANYEELVKNSQEEGTQDDPNKEYWFVKEEAVYEHPYMELKGKKELRELEKKFNEERKKRKKKAT